MAKNLYRITFTKIVIATTTISVLLRRELEHLLEEPQAAGNPTDKGGIVAQSQVIISLYDEDPSVDSGELPKRVYYVHCYYAGVKPQELEGRPLTSTQKSSVIVNGISLDEVCKYVGMELRQHDLSIGTDREEWPLVGVSYRSYKLVNDPSDNLGQKTYTKALGLLESLADHYRRLNLTQ